MRDLGGEAALLEGLFDLLGEHDGAVFAAGATESNRQIAFAFANVMRNEVGKKALNAAEKLPGLRERTDVLLDFGILAGIAAKAGNEMGIGQETDVEDEIGVRRDAKLVAETHDGHEHRTLVGILETLGDEVAQLVDVELSGIDNHVSEFADGFHESALVTQTFADGERFAEGMWAPCFAVAAEKSIVVGVDENQSDGVILAEVLQKKRKLFQLHTFAGVHKQSGAGEIAFASGVQLGKDGNQFDGKIIDAIEAHVFEGAENGAFAGPGETSKDDKLVGVASGERLHGRRRVNS